MLITTENAGQEEHSLVDCILFEGTDCILLPYLLSLHHIKSTQLWDEGWRGTEADTVY